MDQTLSALLTTVGGAIIGFFAALYAGKQAHENNLKLHQVQQQKRINGVLRAVRYELEVFGAVHKKKGGGIVESLPAQQPYMHYFVLGENYFNVYPNNTEIVGQIDDEKLCRGVIATYNQASFLLECCRVNNHYLDKLGEYRRMQLQVAMQTHASVNISSLQESLVAWAAQLKLAQHDFECQRERLFADIANYLQHHEEGRNGPQNSDRGLS